MKKQKLIQIIKEEALKAIKEGAPPMAFKPEDEATAYEAWPNMKFDSKTFENRTFRDLDSFKSDLESCNIRNTTFASSNFEETTFEFCRILDKSIFEECFIKNSYFSLCSFVFSEFRDCTIVNSNFRGNNFNEVFFRRCTFANTEFTGSDYGLYFVDCKGSIIKNRKELNFRGSNTRMQDIR